VPYHLSLVLSVPQFSFGVFFSLFLCCSLLLAGSLSQQVHKREKLVASVLFASFFSLCFYVPYFFPLFHSLFFCLICFCFNFELNMLKKMFFLLLFEKWVWIVWWEDEMGWLLLNSVVDPFWVWPLLLFVIVFKVTAFLVIDSHSCSLILCFIVFFLNCFFIFFSFHLYDDFYFVYALAMKHGYSLN
jgi:hypothetical protein